MMVVVGTTQNCGLLLGFTQYFSSARQATAAPGSPGDLLRVAFSGLCVVLYANWIKNETHFFFVGYLPYICPVASGKLGELRNSFSIINWEMLLMSTISRYDCPRRGGGCCGEV